MSNRTTTETMGAGEQGMFSCRLSVVRRLPRKYPPRYQARDRGCSCRNSLLFAAAGGPYPQSLRKNTIPCGIRLVYWEPSYCL